MRFVISLLIAAVPVVAGAQTYYMNIRNTAQSSIVAFAAAPAGTTNFHDIALADRPLEGGGDSATVAFRKDEGGCLRDLRTTFADGRVLIHKKVNVCRLHTYRTGQDFRTAPPPAAATVARSDGAPEPGR